MCVFVYNEGNYWCLKDIRLEQLTTKHFQFQAIYCRSKGYDYHIWVQNPYFFATFRREGVVSGSHYESFAKRPLLPNFCVRLKF